MMSEKPVGTRWPDDFFINVQRPEFESLSSFFLQWSIVNKYFKLLYSLSQSMRLWFQKISFFFFFLWAGRGRENKNFVLSYGIWYRTTLRGPPYPVVCFQWGFHVLNNSNKILVREIDGGNSRVSQVKSLLTMVKLKSVLIFGIFQSINMWVDMFSCGNIWTHNWTYMFNFHFISAVHIWFISFIINTHFFHGNIWNHNWPPPNVSGFIAQLVEHRTGNREVTGSNPVEVLNFFQASLRSCINCVHCDDHFFICSFNVVTVIFWRNCFTILLLWIGNPWCKIGRHTTVFNFLNSVCKTSMFRG